MIDSSFESKRFQITMRSIVLLNNGIVQVPMSIQAGDDAATGPSASIVYRTLPGKVDSGGGSMIVPVNKAKSGAEFRSGAWRPFPAVLDRDATLADFVGRTSLTISRLRYLFYQFTFQTPQLRFTSSQLLLPEDNIFPYSRRESGIMEDLFDTILPSLRRLGETA